jgi:hypothetical protein
MGCDWPSGLAGCRGGGDCGVGASNSTGLRGQTARREPPGPPSRLKANALAECLGTPAHGRGDERIWRALRTRRYALRPSSDGRRSSSERPTRSTGALGLPNCMRLRATGLVERELPRRNVAPPSAVGRRHSALGRGRTRCEGRRRLDAGRAAQLARRSPLCANPLPVRASRGAVGHGARCDRYFLRIGRSSTPPERPPASRARGLPAADSRAVPGRSLTAGRCAHYLRQDLVPGGERFYPAVSVFNTQLCADERALSIRTSPSGCAARFAAMRDFVDVGYQDGLGI